MNPKPEFETKTVRMAQAIQECVLNQKINPEKDFPDLIEMGLGAEAVECWEALYGDKFRQAKDSLKNSKEFIFELPRVKGFPQGSITLPGRYKSQEATPSNIELSITRA
jgi:hypothetical protein